jgi:hypothetical protein
MAGLEGLTEEQAGQWLRVAWFFVMLIWHRRKERELMDVVFEKVRDSKFREKEEISDTGPTLWEQMQAEGEARGLRHALQQVLQVRFGAIPEEIETAIAGANVQTLDRWFARALTATTLDETGISAGPA